MDHQSPQEHTQLFDNKSTNASAESFNAKINAFRVQYGGVGNVNFFPFQAN
ncbi:hypothetical protein [Solitalea lacus]|uniref:hypothetical protein n=1 Tax=Solitalea lacus TaxID=2911172 RepID=UPI001EDB6235|nr:hypothetical protein [Solitalea lacus]UKJ08503.1 hypothetical protein L2B55_04905 [Solitalea lacus]